MGSSKVLGLDQNVCFERYGRLGAYGLEREPLANGQSSGGPAPVDWDEVDWAALQRQCVDENSNRFDMTPRPMPGERKYEKPASNAWPTNEKGTLKKRTALVFRSYDGMSFTPELVRTMRSVVAEAALGSGGEYEAFLLVQVKDLTKPIFDDPQEYQKVVEGTVPKEFWGMTVLWNEALWDKLYPLVPLEWRK